MAIDYLGDMFNIDDQYTEEEIDAMCSKLNKNFTWKVSVECDENGECFIIFSDELIEKLGWRIDDTIEFFDNEDGSWTLKKV